MYAKLSTRLSSLDDFNYNLSNVFLRLQVRVRTNDFVEAENLVDEGDGLVGIGLDEAVHLLEPNGLRR